MIDIITADVFDGLAQLDAGSVHTCVTSPPYFGLRDYGVAGQIGLEPTPDAFVEKMEAGCPEGGLVLDPFGGAGTTGLVAQRLRRNALLIELNPEYAAMARRRIDADQPPMLAMLEEAS